MNRLTLTALRLGREPEPITLAQLHLALLVVGQTCIVVADDVRVTAAPEGCGLQATLRVVAALDCPCQPCLELWAVLAAERACAALQQQGHHFEVHVAIDVDNLHAVGIADWD